VDNWLLTHPGNTRAAINNLARPASIVYSFDEESLRFSATCIGAEVAWLQVVDDAGRFWLEDVEVGVAYRRRGIGTELMRRAVDTFGNSFRVPLLGISSQHEYWLTPHGHALTIACLNAGIITHAHTSTTPPASS
jgi:GNAT superfamily N-acetyltransferase